MKKLMLTLIACMMMFKAEPVQAASWVDMNKIFSNQTCSWMLQQLQNKINNVGTTPFYFTAGLCLAAAGLYLIKEYKQDAKELADEKKSKHQSHPPRHA